MNNLPTNDAGILASSINFMLRDGQYQDLDDICSAFGVERDFVEKALASGGYAYSPEQNKVR